MSGCSCRCGRTRNWAHIVRVGETGLWVNFAGVEGQDALRLHVSILAPAPLPAAHEGRSTDRIEFFKSFSVMDGPVLLTALLRPDSEYEVILRPPRDDVDGSPCADHAVSLLVHTCCAVELHRLRQVAERSCSLSWIRPSRTATSAAMASLLAQTARESQQVWLAGREEMDEVELSVFEHEVVKGSRLGGLVASASKRALVKTLRVPADPCYTTLEGLRSLTAYSVKVRAVMQSPILSSGDGAAVFGHHPALTPFFVTLPLQECSVSALSPTSLVIRRFREYPPEFTEQLVHPALGFIQLHPPASHRMDDVPERLVVIARWEENEHMRAKAVEDVETIGDFVDVNRAQKTVEKMRKKSTTFAPADNNSSEAAHTAADAETAAAIRRRRSEVNAIMVFQEKRKELIRRKLNETLYEHTTKLPSGWSEVVVSAMLPGVRYSAELQRQAGGPDSPWTNDKKFSVALPAASSVAVPGKATGGPDEEDDVVAPLRDDLALTGPMSLSNLRAFLKLRFSEFVTVEHVSETSCTISWAAVNFEEIAKMFHKEQPVAAVTPAVQRARLMVQAAEELAQRRITLDYCLLVREGTIEPSQQQQQGSSNRLRLAEEEPPSPHMLGEAVVDASDAAADLSSERSGRLLAAIFLRGSAPAPASLKPLCPPGWKMDIFRTYKNDMTLSSLAPGTTYTLQLSMYNAIDRVWNDLSSPCSFTTLSVPQAAIASVSHADGATSMALTVEVDPIAKGERSLPYPHLRPRHAFSFFLNGHVDITLQRVKKGPAYSTVTTKRVTVQELVHGDAAHFRGLEANSIFRVLARNCVPEWKRPALQSSSSQMTAPAAAAPPPLHRPLFVTLVCLPVVLSEVDAQRTVTVSATIPHGVMSKSALWSHTYGVVTLSNAHSRKALPFTPSPEGAAAEGEGGLTVSTQGYDRLIAQAVVVQAFAGDDALRDAEACMSFAWLQEAANLSFAVDWALLPQTINPFSFEFTLSSTILTGDIDLTSGQGAKECMGLLARHAARKDAPGSEKGNLQGLVVVVEVREEWAGGNVSLLKYHCGFDDLLVEDLKPGCKYGIRVRPVLEENSVSGDVYGLWSKRVLFFTPHRLNLSIVGADETSISVRWYRDDFQASPTMSELRAHGSTDPQRSSFGTSSIRDLYSFLYRHSLFGRYRLVWNEVGSPQPQSMETAVAMEYVIKDLKPAALLLVKVQQRRVMSSGGSTGEAILDRSAGSRSSTMMTSSLLASNRGEQSNASFKNDTTWCAATMCVRTLAELCPVVQPTGFNEYVLRLERVVHDDSAMDNTVDDEMLPVKVHVVHPAPVVQAQIRVLPAINTTQAADGTVQGRIGPIPLPADLEDPWPHPADTFVDGDAYWRDTPPTRPWFSGSSTSSSVPLHTDLVDLSVVKPCIAAGGSGEYTLVNLSTKGQLEYIVVGVRPGVASYIQLRYRTQEQPRPSAWSIHAGLVAHFPPNLSVQHASDTSIALLLSSPPPPRFHPSEGEKAPQELQVELIGFCKCDSWDPANEEFEAIDVHGHMYRVERQLRCVEPPASGTSIVLGFDGLRSGACYLITGSSLYSSSLQGPSTVPLCVATIPPAKCTIKHASDVYAIAHASREDPQYEADVQQIVSYCRKLLTTSPQLTLLLRLRHFLGLRSVVVVPPVVSDTAFEVRVVAVRGKDEIERTSVQPHPDAASGDYYLVDLVPGSVYKAFTRPSSIAVAADWSSPALFATKLPMSLRMEESSESSAVFACVLIPPATVPLWAEAEARHVWTRSVTERRLVCVRGDENASESVASIVLQADSPCRVCVHGLSQGCLYTIRGKPDGVETSWCDIGSVATSPYTPSLPSLYEWCAPHVSIFWSYDKTICEESKGWQQRCLPRDQALIDLGRDGGESELSELAASTRIATVLPAAASREGGHAFSREAVNRKGAVVSFTAGLTHRSAPYESSSVRFEIEALDRRIDATKFFSVGQVPRTFARFAWQAGDEPSGEETSDVFFRIRAVVAAPNVGDTKSEWTRPVSFRPVPRLPPPAGLCVEGQLGECVVFRWDAPVGVEAHNQVVYDVEIARGNTKPPSHSTTHSAPRRSSTPLPSPPPPGQHWRVAITVAEPRAVLQNLILREHYRVRVICRTTFSRSVSSVLGVTVFPRSEATRFEMTNAGLVTSTATSSQQVSGIDAAKFPFPLPVARDARPPTVPSPYHAEFANSRQSRHEDCVDLPIPLSMPGPAPQAQQHPAKKLGEVPRKPIRPASASQPAALAAARRRRSDFL